MARKGVVLPDFPSAACPESLVLTTPEGGSGQVITGIVVRRSTQRRGRLTIRIKTRSGYQAGHGPHQMSAEFRQRHRTLELGDEVQQIGAVGMAETVLGHGDPRLPKPDARTSKQRQIKFGIDSHRVPPSELFMHDGHAATPDEMVTLGRKMAKDAGPGTVIALVGGLGAGKTHWTKGFVAESGSSAEVTSPTFGLVHEYSGGRYPVFHLDFYRLESAVELLALGWDELLEQDGVVIAEWGDKFPEIFPAGSQWLQFTVESDGSRSVRQTTLPQNDL